MFKENLNRIIRNENLDETSMAQMINEILSGNATDAQIGAFMGALAT